MSPSPEVTGMSDGLDFATPSAETLHALQRQVEQADDGWFDALAAGESGADERRTFKTALAEYREYEKFCLDSRLAVTCGRCGGDGVVHFGNVTFRTADGGSQRTCFECGGARTVPVRKHKFQSQAPTRLKRVREHEAKQAAKQAALDANWTKFSAEHPEVAAFLAPHVRPEGGDYSDGYDDFGGEKHNDFLCSMRESAARFGGLTEKQMAAVERNMERVADEAAAVEFPTGTHTVEGEIVSLPQTRGYGGGTKTNMLVKLNGDHRGNKIMGTIPEKVWQAMESGDGTGHGSLIGSRVKFTATITKSDRDDHFGFFRSPKKVEVLYVKRDES